MHLIDALICLGVVSMHYREFSGYVSSDVLQSYRIWNTKTQPFIGQEELKMSDEKRREELKAKINEQLDKLSIEELESVAGGAHVAVGDDGSISVVSDI
jgi:hypothetical protein